LASPNAERPLSLVSTEVIALSKEENVVELAQQPWYFGELGRTQAQQLLERTDDGTFIVRHSSHQQQFVISLMYERKAKHMKIEVCEQSRQFYLHEGRRFDSILELVNFYRENNLAEGFTNLNTTLRGTILKGNVYRVLHEFHGRDDVKYLSLIPGELLTVLDTAGEGNGWWKGKINDRVGFFPMRFVARIKEPVEAIECYTLNRSSSSTTIDATVAGELPATSEYGRPTVDESVSHGSNGSPAPTITSFSPGLLLIDNPPTSIDECPIRESTAC